MVDQDSKLSIFTVISQLRQTGVAWAEVAAAEADPSLR